MSRLKPRPTRIIYETASTGNGAPLEGVGPSCTLRHHEYAICEGGILTMPAQRKYFTILALLLGVPLLVTGARAARPQGGEEGGPRGGEGRRGPMSPDDRLKQITEDANTQLRAVLDDKQKEKFDKQEQERMQRMQNRRGGGMGAPRGDSPSGPPPQN